MGDKATKKYDTAAIMVVVVIATLAGFAFGVVLEGRRCVEFCECPHKEVAP